MKIKFEDGSYVEIVNANSDKVKISLASIKKTDAAKVLSVISSEISLKEFTELTNEILGTSY